MCAGHNHVHVVFLVFEMIKSALALFFTGHNNNIIITLNLWFHTVVCMPRNNEHLQNSMGGG